MENPLQSCVSDAIIKNQLWSRACPTNQRMNAEFQGIVLGRNSGCGSPYQRLHRAWRNNLTYIHDRYILVSGAAAHSRL